MKFFSLNFVNLKLITFFVTLFVFSTLNLKAQVKLEKEYKVSDSGLFFDGNRVGGDAANNDTGVYDYRFGPQISAHGDCIKKYKEFIFTTWYRGGKLDRHVMLSRYNIKTGVLKTIEFPHRHTGLKGQWWIGESHNTIAIGLSPKDGTIHMLYDMHSYNNSGAFKDDYFRYAYSKKNAATVPDSEFKLDLFEKEKPGDYTHVSLNGTADPRQFQDMTYPHFFLNDNDDLLMHMRRGGNDNGAYVFAKYNSGTSSWAKLTQFNNLNARNFGEDYNWGLYGSMKYVNGKLRVGFQRRSANENDKYKYQNGFYYAYSDDQSGKTQWKDHAGKAINIPFANADIIKVYEPGNLVSATGKDQVYMVGGFDWTVTDRGDVHIIGTVKDTKNNVTKHVHTYKPAGNSNFITTTNFAGADQLYTHGNSVYIIRLKNGRPFIQKADGGKNNFQTIYEPSFGKNFRHGVPYIFGGKLYYYMMESKSGTKQPLYVQIIDLGMGGGASTPPTVSVIEPGNNVTFEPGTTIDIKADASDDGSIAKVNFRVNNSYFSQDRIYPYTSSWTPTEAGTYTIDAVAYDDGNSSTVSSSITVEITDTNPIVHLKKANSTGYALDGGIGSSDYQNVKLWSANVGNVNQQWEETNIGLDYYRYKKVNSNYCLDAGNGGTNGQNVRLMPCKWSDKNQHWKKVNLGDGKYRLVKRNAQDYSINAGVGGADNQNAKLYQTGTSITGNDVWLFITVGTLKSSSSAEEMGERTNSDLSLKVSVYPNPASDNFMIDLKNIENASVFIYNAAGVLVYQKTTANETLQLEKGEVFDTGIYLIKVIENDRNVYQQKLLIK